MAAHTDDGARDLQRAFNALIEAEEPTEQLVLALGEKLQRARLRDEIPSISGMTTAAGEARAMLIYAARFYDDGIPIEYRRKDLSIVRQSLACLRQGLWAEARGALTEFATIAVAKLRERTEGTGTPPQTAPSIQRVGETWHLRCEGEKGDYSDSKGIRYLARLLPAPNRLFTVADMIEDPEGKIAIDADYGRNFEVDSEELRAIQKRLDDIAELASCGQMTEHMADEKAALLRQIERKKKTLPSQLAKNHHRIASRIRALLGKKLARDMPRLHAHLDAALKMDRPHFGYFPPHGTPRWTS